MKYFEYGKEHGEIAVILHSGGTSYRGVEPTAKLLGKKYHVILVVEKLEKSGLLPHRQETDWTLSEKTHAHLWYGIKGNVDKKLSSVLDGLRKKGYKFDVKIFPELGHGGLAREQPERFVDEVSAAHEKDIGK